MRCTASGSEVGELRLRGQRRRARGGLVAAQERQHPADFVESGRAERPDVRERLACALRLPVEQVQPDAGLHGDLAQRVREHVVQLAGHAGALVLLGGAAALDQLRSALGAAVEAQAHAFADREAGREADRGDRDAERMHSRCR